MYLVPPNYMVKTVKRVYIKFSSYVHFTTISKTLLRRRWDTFHRFHFKDEGQHCLTEKADAQQWLNQPIPEVLPLPPTNAILPQESELLKGRRGGTAMRGDSLTRHRAPDQSPTWKIFKERYLSFQVSIHQFRHLMPLPTQFAILYLLPSSLQAFQRALWSFYF